MDEEVQTKHWFQAFFLWQCWSSLGLFNSTGLGWFRSYIKILRESDVWSLDSFQPLPTRPSMKRDQNTWRSCTEDCMQKKLAPFFSFSFPSRFACSLRVRLVRRSTSDRRRQSEELADNIQEMQVVHTVACHMFLDCATVLGYHLKYHFP